MIENQKISIKTKSEMYYVHTYEENDSYNAMHTYEFSNKDEFLKFVDGEKAVDRYGVTHTISYYEHIKNAYIKGNIDMTSLYNELNQF